MVYLIPIRRQPITQIKRFSKYKDVQTAGEFVLQQRKSKKASKSGKANFRIILRHGKEIGYYEIAYGNNPEQILAREWHYIKDELPNRMPSNLSVKTRSQWILAHFTCRAVETDGASLEADGAMHFGKDLDKFEEEQLKKIRQLGDETEQKPIPSSPASNSSSTSSSTASSSTHNSERKETTGISIKGFQSPSSILVLRGLSVLLVATVVVNIPALLMREASMNSFFLCLFTVNVFLGLSILAGTPFTLGICSLEPTKAASVHQRRRSTNHHSHVASSAHSVGEDSSDDEEEGDSEEDEIATSIPNVHAETAAEPAAILPSSGVKIAATAHCQLKEATDVSDRNCVSDPLGSSWTVRTGPNYARNKQKAASGPALMECVGLDTFRCERKIQHIGQCLDLTPLLDRKPIGYFNCNSEFDSDLHEAQSSSGHGSDDSSDHEESKHVSSMRNRGKGAQGDSATKGAGGAGVGDEMKKDASHLPIPGISGDWDSPWVLIVNMQLPAYAPSMWTAKTDGPGWSLINYFVPSAATKAGLKNEDEATAGTRLMKEWMTSDWDSEKGIKFLDRFKGLGRMLNYMDVPELGYLVKQSLKNYNGKPWLTRPQHDFYRGPGYIEFDLDVHRFSYPARNAFGGIVNHLDKLVCDAGFVIEAYGDEEQPEQVLCNVRLFRIEGEKAPIWDDVIKEATKKEEERKQNGR